MTPAKAKALGYEFADIERHTVEESPGKLVRVITRTYECRQGQREPVTSTVYDDPMLERDEAEARADVMFSTIADAPSPPDLSAFSLAPSREEWSWNQHMQRQWSARNDARIRREQRYANQR